MKFWDSSAIVPLVLLESESSWARRTLKSDPHGLVWCLSPVEVRSALARRSRDGALTVAAFDASCRRAQRLFQALSQILAIEAVRSRAFRLLDVHPLSAADALQLSAAITAAKDRPQDLPFVTLDERLAEAAKKEGFPVEIAG
jgi:predicted nucleic acid-binding protein